MTAKYMLDTDMCIYIAKRRPPQAQVRFTRVTVGEVVISVITHGELAFGAAKSKRAASDQASLDRMLLETPIMPLGEETSAIYGAIRADLESKGQTIGGNDLWIGAHALSLGLILVTNNVREFSRVSGLKIENWLREAL